jgi:SAM-dependent methyltransferase
MPSIRENRKTWKSYGWGERGDEWSRCWGSTETLWNGTIMPRIHQRVPCGHLLEIAPGYGRITRFLVGVCDRFTGVDLTPNCVKSCRRRFADRDHATFHLNDGKSLDAVEDRSVDFAFSWDSLVHVDSDVIGAYLHGLARKLKPGSFAFLHHSNLGEYVDPENGTVTVPNEHWRDPTVSAAGFRETCREAGLTCVSQELVQWLSDDLIDCFSVVRRPEGAPVDQPTEVTSHPDFAAEYTHLRELYEARLATGTVEEPP